MTKYRLACTATATQTARDALEALRVAIFEAEDLIGVELQEDCRDPDSGQVYPLVIVSDNGPAFKSDLFLRFILANPALEHVRTRYRAPQTNGIVERWTGTLKYDHLYRIEIASGHDLARECETYRLTYNEVRPHESLAFSTPDSVYRALPTSPPGPVPGRFSGIQSLGPDVEAGADERLVKQPKLFLAQTVQKS